MNEIQKKSAFFYFVSEIEVGSVSKLDLFCKNIIVIYGDILCKPISNINVSSNATRCIHGKLIRKNTE